MSVPRILVVDDEKKTAESIRLYLQNDGCKVVVAYNGTQALEEVARERPDLVILDLMLPRIDGLEVCRRIREHSQVPIIMLTAKSTEDDKLTGLELGADDYVTKPFSPRELVARVRTVLRRAPQGVHRAATLCDGDLELDPEGHAAKRGGALLDLTPREFALLLTFMNAPGRAFSRQELVEYAFGEDYAGFDRTVDAHVVNLRRKIEVDPAHPTRIVTVFGVGYRFEATP